MTPQVVIRLLSLLTLLANLGLVLFFLLFSLKGVGLFKSLWKKTFLFLEQKAILFSFIVSLSATLGSLYLSEIAHFEPCKLCWFQRIFMYPLPIILGVALYKNLKEVRDFVLPLSVIGGLIAIYHYYFQISGNPLIPCSAVGFSVSCSQRFFTHFGYITIPWMSFSAFLMVSVLMKLAANFRKRNKPV